MSRHAITIALLVVALALYALGIKGWGLAFFVAGAVVELLFWARIISSRESPTRSEASNSN